MPWTAPTALSKEATTLSRTASILILSQAVIQVCKSFTRCELNLIAHHVGAESCGTAKPANVISTSYGYDEADLTPFYTARQCAEYAKLGLMGVTVLFSSGDNGVAGNGGVCLTADGTQRKNGAIFNPSFPSKCPGFRTLSSGLICLRHMPLRNCRRCHPTPRWKEGRTRDMSVIRWLLTYLRQITDPESATYEVIYSGGGFSNYFPMPDWQKSAVQGFLKNHHPSYSTTLWNATGSRAYPDLSANGCVFSSSLFHTDTVLN